MTDINISYINLFIQFDVVNYIYAYLSALNTTCTIDRMETEDIYKNDTQVSEETRFM